MSNKQTQSTHLRDKLEVQHGPGLFGVSTGIEVASVFDNSYMGVADWGKKEYREASDNAIHLAKCWNMHEELVQAVEQAKMQIEYLHEKFQETGSGNAVLSKLDRVLEKAE